MVEFLVKIVLKNEMEKSCKEIKTLELLPSWQSGRAVQCFQIDIIVNTVNDHFFFLPNKMADFFLIKLFVHLHIFFLHKILM